MNILPTVVDYRMPRSFEQRKTIKILQLQIVTDCCFCYETNNFRVVKNKTYNTVTDEKLWMVIEVFFYYKKL